MGLLDASLVRKLAPALEHAINIALSMDPASRNRLKPLQGCVLELHFLSLKQSLFFGAEDGRVVLYPTAKQASVTLSGTIPSFLKLAASQNKSALFKSREVSLSGDAVRAQQIQQFAAGIDIDWEGLLAEIIGDVPAHFVGSSIRQSLSWTKHLSGSLRRDIEEFIKYELRLLPGKALGNSQFDAIDQLRLATDRLEARIKKLVTSGAPH